MTKNNDLKSQVIRSELWGEPSTDLLCLFLMFVFRSFQQSLLLVQAVQQHHLFFFGLIELLFQLRYLE